MTAQMTDRVWYEGKEYSLIGIKGDGLLKPQDFDLHPRMWHTACYRGYIATYACEDSELFLQEMKIGYLNDDSDWKAIEGIQPEPIYARGSERSLHESGKIWRNLQLITGFTGGLLIADGFIRQLYVHMGFGKPYQYETVRELLFHEGLLINAIDHSKKAAEWRDYIINKRQELEARAQEMRDRGLSADEIAAELRASASDEDIRKDIEWRFSMDYDNWF